MDSTKESELGGYWCDVCKCSLKDNKSWLDHINGRKRTLAERAIGRPAASRSHCACRAGRRKRGEREVQGAEERKAEGFGAGSCVRSLRVIPSIPEGEAGATGEGAAREGGGRSVRNSRVSSL